jgi:hypothetical protein
MEFLSFQVLFSDAFPLELSGNIPEALQVSVPFWANETNVKFQFEI